MTILSSVLPTLKYCYSEFNISSFICTSTPTVTACVCEGERLLMYQLLLTFTPGTQQVNH